MSTNIPSLPAPGSSVRVTLEELPDFLDAHGLEIVHLSNDGKNLTVRRRQAPEPINNDVEEYEA